jgi:hypothetical protein
VPGAAAVVQRVHWNSLTHSANGNYGVNTADPTKLYSQPGAPDPQPVGLYRKTRESDTSNGWPFFRPQVNVWEPNAVLFNKDLRDQYGTRVPNRRVDIPDNWTAEPRPRTWKDDWFPGSAAGRDRAYHQQRLTDLTTAVEDARDGVRDNVGHNGTTCGIVGINDCESWATVLQKRIFEELNPVPAPNGLTLINQNNYQNIPNAAVGDRISQSFGAGALSGTHGVTVVARDLPTLVTLEAHVEQNLTKPAFHFYAGTAGFFQANNAGPLGANQFLAANGVRGSISALSGSQVYSLDSQVESDLHDMIADPDIDTALDGVRMRLNAWYVEE